MLTRTAPTISTSRGLKCGNGGCQFAAEAQRQASVLWACLSVQKHDTGSRAPPHLDTISLRYNIVQNQIAQK